jgi:hypothetical protein
MHADTVARTQLQNVPKLFAHHRRASDGAPQHCLVEQSPEGAVAHTARVGDDIAAGLRVVADEDAVGIAVLEDSVLAADEPGSRRGSRPGSNRARICASPSAD